MLGAGWVSFLRFFLLAFSGRSGRSSLARPPVLHPSSLPNTHSAVSLSPPPPPTPGLPPPRCQPALGRGLRRGGQTKGPGQTRGTPLQLPTTWPLPPPAAGGSPSPPSQRSGEFGPEASSFPGHVRANRSAAGAEPSGASNTKECTGRGGGDAGRTEAALSVPRLGNDQPKGGDSSLAVGRLLVQCE